MAPWTGCLSGCSISKYDGTVEKHTSRPYGAHRGRRGQDREEEGRTGTGTGTGSGSGSAGQWGSRVPITTVETSVHAAEMTVPRRQIVWFSRGGSVKCVGDVRESRVGMTSRRTVQYYLLGRYAVSLDAQKDKKGRDGDDKDCDCDSVTTTMTTKTTRSGESNSRQEGGGDGECRGPERR